MTNSRKLAILCEILKQEIENIQKLLSAIEKWYHVSAKELKDKKAQLKKRKDTHEYDWDDFDYELYMTNKVKRAMYASVAVALSAVAEDFLFCLCVNVGLMKVEIKKGKDGREKRIINNFNGKKIKRPFWGCYRQLIENKIKIQFDKISCFDSIKRVRLLNNCFKHSYGITNEDFVKSFGGTLGDDICYESERWQELIKNCETFMLKLAERIGNQIIVNTV